MIDLHFCPTPNCWKIVILLEETGQPYSIVPYDIMNGEQLKPDYAAINPNHKVPAIVDHDPPGGGAPFAVFESGAILIYLAEKAERFLPADPQGRSLVLQWLIWQVAGLGPMYGQSNHFIRYARDRHEYSLERYHNESLRLTQVLDNKLRSSEYIAGNYSIADIAVWPWIAGAKLFNIDLGEFPNVQRWFELVGGRPAVQRAYTAPETAPNPKFLQEKAVLSDEEWSNSFGENLRAAVRSG